MNYLYLVLIFVGLLGLTKSQQQYLYYDEMVSRLSLLARENPNRVYLYSIGKSVENRDLWVIAVAKNQPKVHVPLRPEIKLVGNIHGNELPTGEVLLRFVEYLLSNPDNDKRVDEILTNSRLHVLVSMNPDGTEIASRESCTSKVGRNNSNKLDLNRNFPDAFFCNSEHLEPETVAVLEWMESLKFVLSGSFHTGAMVTSYGYENWRFSYLATKPQYVATDHDDALRYLAKTYSIHHKTMRNTICDNETFIDGITNGANWWPPVRGGMQDINYWRYGCYEITMEIGCCLIPPASELPKIWDDNKESLIEFTHAANIGVKGIIKYQNGQPARYIGVRFGPREPIFKTSEIGEYFALILPGTYNMSLLFNCDTIYNSVVYVHHKSGQLVFNITLDDRLFFLAFYYNLDKYALFCDQSKAPVDCSNSLSRYRQRNSAMGLTGFGCKIVVAISFFIVLINRKLALY